MMEKLNTFLQILFAFVHEYFDCVSVLTLVDIIIGQFLCLRLSALFPTAEPDSATKIRHLATLEHTAKSWPKQHNHKD